MELLRPSSLVDVGGDGGTPLAGGTELVPLLRDGLVEARALVHIQPLLPRGVRGTTIGAGTTLAELESSIFGNERCASAHPSDPAAGLLALGATVRTTVRELPLADLYRLPTDGDRSTTTLERDELILELDVPRLDASVYLKAMARAAWSFPIVGVAAARFGAEIRLGLAGVAPVPWTLTSIEALESAKPLPGTAHKVEIARALVRRALGPRGRADALASRIPMRRRLLLLLFIAVLSGTGASLVTTARAGKGAALAARIPALPEVDRPGPACPVPDAYRAAFERASEDTGLPLAVLVAVAQVESRFEPTAVSNAGARGLLQVMPTTAQSLELSADSPESNVLAGARYLRNLLDRFRSTDLALAAYNAGPTAVSRAGGAPTAQTITYVANVTSLWRSLNGCS